MRTGLFAQFEPAVLAVPSLMECASLYMYDPLALNPFLNGRSILNDNVQELPSDVFVRSNASFSLVSSFL